MNVLVGFKGDVRSSGMNVAHPSVLQEGGARALRGERF